MAGWRLGEGVARLHRSVPSVRALLATGHSHAGGTDPVGEVRELADLGLLGHLHLGDDGGEDPVEASVGAARAAREATDGRSGP